MNASNILSFGGNRPPLLCIPRERLGGLAIVLVAHLLLGTALVYAMHRTVKPHVETEISVQLIAPPKPEPVVAPMPRPMAKNIGAVTIPRVDSAPPLVAEQIVPLFNTPQPAPVIQAEPEKNAALPATSASGTADSNPLVDASAAGNAKPLYPRASKALGEQGVVVLEVFVTADGAVGDIRVNHSSGFDRLDDSALHAVRQWHFIPARQGGKPVAMWYKQPITFDLHSV